MEMVRYQRKNRDWTWNLIAFSLVVTFLYFGREVFIPLALSLLLAFLLHPPVHWLQRRGLTRVPAVLAAFTVTFVLLTGMLFQVGREFASLMNDLPKYRTELASKAKGIRGWGDSLERVLGNVGEDLSHASAEDLPGANVAEADKESVDRPPDLPGGDPRKPLYVVEARGSAMSWQRWAQSAGALLGPLGTAGLVLVFTLFLMIYQDDLRDRMIKLVSGGQYVTTTRALNESAQRISGYLMAQAFINFSYGAIITLGLWGISVTLGGNQPFPNSILWGFLCATLRFVPYIGPVVSSLFPLTIALAVFPGFKVFAAVLALIVLVELISNNVLEPWLYGSSTGLSAMAVIFASVFWGWIWGPVGLLLATPLTVCLVVLGKHFQGLRPFQTLLGDDEPLPIATRFYQRLLAGNTLAAKQLAEQQTKEFSRLSFLDTTLIPAIAHIRADREAGRLDRVDEQSLNQSLAEILAHIEEWDQSSATKTQASIEADNQGSTSPQTNGICSRKYERLVSNQATILLLPSHHAYEEMVLSQLGLWLKTPIPKDAEPIRLSIDLLSTKTSTSQVQQHIASQPPSIVVIGIFPPGGLLQAEYLCELIRQSTPSAQILVAWFGKPPKFDKLLVRLRRKGVSYVPTSLEQTVNFLASILETLPEEPKRANSASLTAAVSQADLNSRGTTREVRTKGDSTHATP